jgi:hypothetical protein
LTLVTNPYHTGDSPISQHIISLLLNFLQLILHHYHQLLHGRVVGFRTYRVDLAANFLADEIQLSSW